MLYYFTLKFFKGKLKHQNKLAWDGGRNGRLEEEDRPEKSGVGEEERHGIVTFLAWICWIEDHSVPRRGIFSCFSKSGNVFYESKIPPTCPFYKVLVQPPIESKVFGHRNSFPHWCQLTNGMQKSFSNLFGS